MAGLLLPATPLIALEAVAIDTETTGLDPRRARVIEIGAVEIAGQAVREEHGFQTLVAIDAAVPARSTAIHGIGDADLAGAPDFPAAFAAFSAFVRGQPWIGHNIGFDLAVLQRECARAGRAWTPPPALDVRLLAQAVERHLPDYDLEALAAWLGLPVATARHRALPDAAAAARVFVALVPRLRDIGIRTFAEAEAACRREESRPGAASPRDWHPADAAARRPQALERLDAYPYRHRLADLMSAPALVVGPSATVRDALAAMLARPASSVLVGDAAAPASALAIFTERDLLREIARAGEAILDGPVGPLASRPLVTVPETAFVYRAIGRMAHRGLRHLAVTGAGGRVTGMVSARDLLRLRATAAIALGDDIDTAADTAALGRAWAKLPAAAQALLAEGIGGRMIAAVVAHELAALTARAGALAQERMAAAGAGGPPCAYALLILGSGGRGESLLAMDQDNALVFAEGAPGGEADGWFARFGAHVAEILHEVGVPYCPGGVMAREPAFRGSLATWRGRVRAWIGRSKPEDLLAVDIFFDFGAVCGDAGLAEMLWGEAWAAARGAIPFLKLLAAAGEGGESPFGLLGGLKTAADGRIDLKATGLRRLVGAARVLALRHGVAKHGTGERLAGIAALGVGGGADLAALQAAQAAILDAILRQQLADIAVGIPPSNRVAPALLGKPGAARLKRALSSLSVLDDLARDQLAG